MKVVILGTAHGSNVPGKQSPDGEFREYAYSRKIINQVKSRLEALGFIVFVDIPQDIVPTPQKIELQNRVSIVNKICAKYGTNNCLYVSIHVNAAGSDGEWKNAGGWCAFTTKGKTKSDIAAECLYEEAETELKDYEKIMVNGIKNGIYSKKQRPYRTDKTDGDKDLESNFYVIYHTKCPAVLTENLFQDNPEDVAYLISERGINAIVNLHVKGVIKYFER
ncbi:MAG: N-acetylmuramoyl-L-alanine amidase [Bacteroidales bacterium]|nr:N-acetylmuramoyl-L-alanine amidase [Bacteroidales bacterium]